MCLNGSNLLAPFRVCVMPHLPALPAPPVPTLPKGRVCPSCNAPMRLVTVEPHPLYLNIDIHDYACDCGHNGSFVVATRIDDGP